MREIYTVQMRGNQANQAHSWVVRIFIHLSGPPPPNMHYGRPHPTILMDCGAVGESSVHSSHNVAFFRLSQLTPWDWMPALRLYFCSNACTCYLLHPRRLSTALYF